MKNKKMVTKTVIQGLLFLLLILAMGCTDRYFPEPKDAFDRDVNFTRTLFEPVMGQITVYSDVFNSANSTLPLTFEITNMKHVDGTPAPELEEFYPVKVWKTPYLGTETSIAEINAKREVEYRRLFDVRKHTGEFIMWGEANSSILRSQPDSGYIFSVKISNSGGYKTIRNLRLRPKREVEFLPSIYDAETGLAIAEYVHPDLVNMRYEKSGSSFSSLIDEEDVHVYIRENKDEKNPNTTLQISFFNEAWEPINPGRFNETDWRNMFQAGFLQEMTPTHVKYEMAYPLPLFQENTNYTNSAGDRAHVKFAASYLTESKLRRQTSMEIDFAIYKEAHWEMLVHFSGGTPMLGDVN